MSTNHYNKYPSIERMPNMVISEYDLEIGKFKRTIAFPKFAYAGEFIIVCESTGIDSSLAEAFDYHNCGDRGCRLDGNNKYNKDLLDPLNRFDGLFNGRTYGEGRFILSKEDQDGVYRFANGKLYLRRDSIGIKSSRVGCIHKNPELLDVCFNK